MFRAFGHIIVFWLVSLAVTACQPPITDTDGAKPNPPSEPVAFDLNDVSILLPPPTSPDDPILSIADLGFDGSSVWPDDAFAQFQAIANSEAGAVAAADVANNPNGARIDISAFADKAVWHVAAIRVDPGAPGLSPEIAAAFGQAPQLRLVLQPVTAGAKVHDVAAHLIYSYTAGAALVPGCPLPRLEPDRDRFQRVVDDLASIKSRLAAGEIGDETVDTGGPLGVHPAADPAKTGRVTRAAFMDELKAFLEAHLDPTKLRAMAIMGLPGGGQPEPWIFLAMAMEPRLQRFVPLPAPALAQDSQRFAQMLDARRSASSNPSVSPAARANNLNAVTCAFEVGADHPSGATPPATPRGVSTAELFPNGDATRMREIVDVIADPARAHFFNTDCVSCHTETRREMDLLRTTRIDAPVDPDVLPTELWNVRNFGWFPSFLNPGVPRATATRRTAAETKEVVGALNALLKER
ncbi:MAG: hypothetical protein R3F54_03860 [Alphaproteobacteria bacterium]